MACTTKLNRLNWLQFERIENECVAMPSLPGAHRHDVLNPWTVASLASHPLNEAAGVKTIAGGRRSGVAAKAEALFRGINLPPERIFKIGWSRTRMAGTEIKCLRVGIEAQPTFVKPAVSFVNVSLANLSDAESPRQRGGNRIRPIRDRIRAALLSARDVIVIRADLQSDLVV